MTKNALIYAWMVIATGVAVLACAALGWQSGMDGSFLVCLGLAACAATFKVRLPNLTGTLSPAFIFLLVAIATQSWTETVVIAAVSGIVQCVWRPRSRPNFLQIAFNASTVAISGGVAHALARATTAAAHGSSMAVVLGAAGVALLVSNTLLLSTMLCLIQEGPFEMIWRSVQLWAVPYYIGGGVLAAIWTNADLESGVVPVILAAISAYVLTACFRELSRMHRATV